VKIAMVSGQASPLAEPGTAEADGQNVDLAELASALAAQDHEVTVYTRRADRNVPEEVRAPGGYRVVHLSAGPPEPVPRDSLLPHLPELTRALAARLSRSRPDVVHAHFWMSGMMSLAATREVPVPVVVTALGRMTDTVVDEVTGLLVPPYQPAALLHALERVLGDQMLRESLGVAGADRARSRYSWDRAATETVRVYEEVTAETRNATAAAQ
jgi:hypothetical protein